MTSINCPSTRKRTAMFLAALLLVIAGLRVALSADVYGSMLPPPDGRRTDVEREAGSFALWLASFDGVPLFRDAGLSQPHDARAGYLEEFVSVWHDDLAVLLARRASSNATEASEIVGYARRADLLGSYKKAYRCLKAPNGVQRKALVVHQWKQGSEQYEQAVLRDRPADDGAETERLKLYEITYIFAQRDTDPKDPSKGWSLVGRRPYMTVEVVRERETLRGWISNKRVFAWDSREAVEYNKDAEAVERRADEEKPVALFLTEGDAREGKAAMKEDLAERNTWKYYQQRFPIIQEKSFQIHGCDYMKIGAIGDSVAGRELVPRQLEDDIRQHIEMLDKNVKGLDVLFVIDATGSMGQFYESIKNSIDGIKASIESKVQQQPIRYAVTHYRDYTEEKDPDSFVTSFRDFVDSATFSTYFDKTSPNYVPSRGGHDAPPTFFALDTAVKSVTWGVDRETRLPTAMRIVILIGDMGNDDVDARGLSLDHVIKTMQEHRCAFYAIEATPGRDHPKIKLFNEQAKQLCEILKMPNTTAFKADGQDLSKAITENIQSSVDTVRVLHEVLGRLMHGEPIGDAIVSALVSVDLGRFVDSSSKGKLTLGDEGKRFGNFLTNYFFNSLPPGVDPKIFFNARIQPFFYTYAARQLPGSDQPQFKTRVLLSKSELQRLCGALGQVEREALTNESVDTIWRRIVEDLLGERDDRTAFDDARPLSEYFAKSLGIPVRSPFLQMSVASLKKLPPEKMAEWQDEIRSQWNRLSNYDNEKSPDGKQSEKHYFPLGGIDYGWVPIELLP